MLGAFLPARLILLLLLALVVSLASGCSWTSGLFGGSDSPEQTQSEGEAPKASTDGKDLDMNMGAAQESKSTPAPKAESAPAGKQEPASEKAAVQDSTAKEEKAAAKEPAKPEAEEEIPEIKARGRVPLERADGSVVTHTGDIDYRTSEALLEAVEKASTKDTFLGYTEPFDAFPVLDGADTISAAFVPADYPHHKIFYHMFYQPNQPFHERVYGYTVIDMRTNQDYGHFDGNADGIFEQKTLDPKIIIDDYLKTSEKAPGAAQ